MPNFNFRRGGSWVQGTPYKRENGQWVPLSTTVVGGGGSYNPDIPADATWVRMDGNTVVAETADGTTYSGSSADDVVESVSLARNGAIAFESGTYPWTGMGTLDSNTQLLGDGTVNIDCHGFDTSTDVQAVEIDQDNIIIENLNFFSDGTAKDCISRVDKGPRRDNIEVRWCEFHNFDNRGGTSSDVHVINADNWYDSVIENCYLTGVGYSAVRIHAGGETGYPFWCRNNVIELQSGAQQAVMTDSRYSFIQNNRINLGNPSGNSYGVRLQDIWATYDKEAWIEGNTFEATSNSNSRGVYAAGSRFYTLDITSNNQFINLEEGIGGNLQAGTNIISNRFEDCVVGITSSDSTNINISNNEFVNCGTNVTF